MAREEYRCEAKSKDAFVAQLIRYVTSGHYFYFACTLKPGKDPKRLDEKLISHFGLAKPYWKRSKRWRGERPNIHYLRYDRFYVLIGTHGREGSEAGHPLFREYPGQVRDIRRHAILFHGYSIRYSLPQGSKRRKVFVRLTRDAYADIRRDLVDKATRPSFRDREAMEAAFRARSYEFQPYGPVHEQLSRILKDVNRRRRYAGFETARSTKCIPRFTKSSSVYSENAVQPLSAVA